MRKRAADVMLGCNGHFPSDGKLKEPCASCACFHADPGHMDFICDWEECDEAICHYVPGWMWWRTLDEELPPVDEMVLVTCKPKKGKANVNRAYRGEDGFWHGSGSMSGVIAWMPLPWPYEGE